MYTYLEIASVLCAILGVSLVTSQQTSRRLLGFQVFLIGAVCSAAVFLYANLKAMLTQSAVMMIINIIGIKNNLSRGTP